MGSLNFFSLLFLGISVFFGTLSIFPPYSIHTISYVKKADIKPYELPPLRNIENLTYSFEKNLKYIDLGEHHGPESITVNSKGDLYFSGMSGEIRYIKKPFDIISKLEIKKKPTESYYFSNTGGRPLGIDIDKDDNLLVADSVKGLLKIDKDTGDIVILSSVVNGTKINFANDVTSNFKDGMIYFTDSTEYSPFKDKLGDWNTLSPSLYTCITFTNAGRLLSYNPSTKETKILMDGLYYSNGIALDDKGESIFVAETCTCRIIRYWIKGKNAGKSTILINDLPGYPDGLDFHNNKLYISIFGGRSSFSDFLNDHIWLKRIYYNLPFSRFYVDKPSLVIANSNTGEILKSLNSKDQTVMTSAYYYENNIYIGNLFDTFITVYNLAKEKK